MENQSVLSAVIADDEPLLAAALRAELTKQWPELHIVKVVGNGNAALSAIVELKPNVAFLDIRMPGLSGIEVAKALAGDDDEPCETAIIFVTAYDEYATQAFETAAIDYLLKPLTGDRLAKCITRLKKQLNPATPTSDPNQLLAQLQRLLSQNSALGSNPISQLGTTVSEPLRAIRASVGDSIKIIPIDEVLYFQAADKYVVVMTATGELLIREPLKDLSAQLDSRQFVQIHRGYIVNMNHVQEVQRDELGKQYLLIKNHKQKLVVSRLYAHLFKAM